MDFRFTNDLVLSQLEEAVFFMMGPRLWIPGSDYPDFTFWAEKTYKQLKNGAKRAMVALNAGSIVGLTVYQRYETLSDHLEIKNLTVRPDQRGRRIASFLLRNTEIEGAAEMGSRGVVCDAKARNLPIRYFLARNGYRIAGRTDLYGLGSGDDLVYTKRLGLSKA